MATDNHNAKAMETKLAEGNSSFQNKDKQPMYSDDATLSVHSYGDSFTPHHITVTKGEDVVRKMKYFPFHHATTSNSLLTVLSANGTALIADIIKCGEKTYRRYFGCFKILSLSWTVELDSNHIPLNYDTRKLLKVVLVNLYSGRVLGGVAYRLVADSPIEIFVGSFKKEIGMSFDGASSSSPSPSIGKVVAELVSNDTPVEDYDKITHRRSI
ncbi:AT-hook motif nuclear-localized protein 14-like [Cannabis sativa]|uniref:AT-hook motif nuclear-localized protein 14-like n=1 Tax=Cannabis sativa TaxID=3483 RepID=UPI0029C9D794|nr:AT-hook motif nuclear-localized protein 14-like [Cannabis sativa]